jgi:hypothetical protein
VQTLVTALLVAAPAFLAACQVEPFRGATSPEGAVARVSMVNDGKPCMLQNYGIPAERGHPASSGQITAPPRSGSAVFVPPAASYTPHAGFVGQDEFRYEAQALGRNGSPLTLRVRVVVSVEAPR